MKNLGIKLMLIGMLLLGLYYYGMVNYHTSGSILYTFIMPLLELKTPGICCLVAGFLIPSADTVKGIVGFFKKLKGKKNKDQNNKEN